MRVICYFYSLWTMGVGCYIEIDFPVIGYRINGVWSPSGQKIAQIFDEILIRI